MARARKLRLSKRTIQFLVRYLLNEAGMKINTTEPESIAAALFYTAAAGEILFFLAGDEATKTARPALAELVALAASAMVPGEQLEWEKIANTVRTELYSLLEEVSQK